MMRFLFNFIIMLAICGLVLEHARASEISGKSEADGAMSAESAYLLLRAEYTERRFSGRNQDQSAALADVRRVRETTSKKNLILMHQENNSDGSVDLIFKAADKADPLVIVAKLLKQNTKWVIESESISHEGNSPAEQQQSHLNHRVRHDESIAMMNAAAQQAFTSTPMAGVVEGKKFAPTVASSVAYADPRFGGYRNQLRFLDSHSGQEVQIEVCLLAKPTDIQGAKNNARTGILANLTKRTQNSVSSGGEFGLKVSLGKLNNNKLPVHLIFKEDKDNYFQGFMLCDFQMAHK